MCDAAVCVCDSVVLPVCAFLWLASAHSVKKGTEQAAQAAADTASNLADSVRSTAGTIAGGVRSAPETLQQVRLVMCVLN